MQTFIVWAWGPGHGIVLLSLALEEALWLVQGNRQGDRERCSRILGHAENTGHLL